MGIDVICPKCGLKTFEVYFGDKVCRWRCFYCNNIFSYTIWEFKNNKLCEKGYLENKDDRLKSEKVFSYSG